MKTAIHKYFEDTVVKFKEVRDFLDNKQIKITFDNGETSTMSPKRFNELFKIN